MKTRSKPTAKDAKEISVSGPTLSSNDENPGKLFILPSELSQEARLVTLHNPAINTPNRYLYCPQHGFFEFTKVSAPAHCPQSWLFVKDRDETEGTNDAQKSSVPNSTSCTSNQEDYVASSGDMLIATPFDALFFFLPALHGNSKLPHDQLYLSVDDYVEALKDNSDVLRTSLQSTAIRRSFEQRLRAVCDVVDAGEEQMFRLSRPKLFQELTVKAQRMSEGGLPSSMESKFVQEPLESPIFNVGQDDKAKDNLSDSNYSQTVGTKEQKQEPPCATDSIDDEMKGLLRVRVALQFMLKTYLPGELRLQMEEMLKSNDHLNFDKLDEHLGKLSSIRSKALALRSMSENISRKRGLDDGDEAVEARAEKKRKQEEEERRKKNENRSIKQLKKVNTSGMKKLSSFFNKAQPKKASSG